MYRCEKLFLICCAYFGRINFYDFSPYLQHSGNHQQWALCVDILLINIDNFGGFCDPDNDINFAWNAHILDDKQENNTVFDNVETKKQQNSSK